MRTRGGDLNAWRCTSCGNYWASNTSRHAAITIRVCPDCIAHLPAVVGEIHDDTTLFAETA